MVEKLKIIILVLVILLASSLTIVFSIQNSKLKLFREYNQTKQRLDSALTQNAQLQSRFEVIQKDLQRISSQRDELQRKYELVNKERQELIQQAGEYTQLQSDLDSYKKENELLKKKVNSLEKDRQSLQADLSEFKQEEESLKEKIEEAKQILKQKTLLTDYSDTQDDNIIRQPQLSSINLPPIVVSSQGGASPSPPSLYEASIPSLRGEILNVNKEYNFVVIDLGQSSAVKEGMVFQVLRSNSVVGKVEVIQVRKDISACDIIGADKSFKVGDVVSY